MKYLQLIRIRHWFKNVLIFVPVVFNRNFNYKTIIQVIIGFLCFCFIASFIYIFNDIQDVNKDRLHITKRQRPIASGAISISTAWMIAALLFSAAVCALCYLYYICCGNKLIFILPASYLIINILYSKGLKNIAVLDVLILAAGFYIRTLFGSAITNVVMSNWLYFVILFGALYLGFGKRRNEMNNQTTKTRDSLEHYTKGFLDKNMYVCLSLAIMSYSLWCNDKITLERIGNNYLIFTVPIILAILFSYGLTIEKDSDGDPIEVLFSNKPLILLVTLYCFVMLFILYIL